MGWHKNSIDLESKQTNTETANLTLTFEIGARHVILICLTLVPYYLEILQCIRKLQPGHESKHTNNETASVTFTFVIGA